MSKKNDDFFKEKKPWSEVKDQLLGCYFKPYVQKILHTNRPLVYVDCFAGKGKFDDGSPGSPLIALEIINDCLGLTTKENAIIKPFFIDKNYASDLKLNLASYESANIVPGKYEDNIVGLLSDYLGYNVFLYIDPYGIKALQCSIFDSLSKMGFNTIELLINLNSFGFIREACHALGTDLVLDDKTVFDDLIEYDPTQMTASDKSITDLNEIAGGDYWKGIIEDFKANRIDGYKAEELFAEQYCKRLMQNYRYVLNMPLRIHERQRPKYRMVHATNHHSGCLIMVDNICKRWEYWQSVQSSGQMSMFQQDVNNMLFDEKETENKVRRHYSQYSDFVSLSESLASFFVQNGPICSKSVICSMLSQLEKAGQITVKRNPATTKKGKQSTFMTENSTQSVWVRWSR